MTDIFFNVLRKGLVATIALMFAFVLIYIPQEFNHHTVHEAEAFLGVDIPNLVQNTISAVKSVVLSLKEFVLDGIAWAIAKAIVARLVASLVDWINSGFKGSPAFISDLGKFLLDALDEEAGRFIEQLGGPLSFLCDPFKLDIQIAIAIQYDAGRENRPYEGCKISDMVNNVDEFFSGTFKEGGWKDWISVTMEPESHTPYGQTIEAQKNLAINLAKKEANQKQEANMGGGFKSVKICENVETPSGNTVLQCNIAAPGRIIADSLSKSLGAGQDTLVTADEISEIVGALIGQLANKAITGAKGLLGLSGGTGYTYSGYSGGSFTSAATAEASNTAGLNDGLKLMQDSLVVQNNYKTLADSSIWVLQAYIANRRTPVDKRQVAQSALDEALEVQLKAPQFSATLQTLITSYQALDATIAAALTNEEKEQARQEQLDIINTYVSLNVYSKEQLDGSKKGWNPSYF